MIAWSKGVNATSYRAGFIASGDLAVAARLIESEGDGRGSAGATQDVEQLVIYGVSEDYFAIRAHLGLAIVG
jgi:hypothetical protein